MGGTFLIVLPALTLLANSEDRSHGRYAQDHLTAFAILAEHLKLFLRATVSWMVFFWLGAGALLYVCALVLQKLKINFLSRLVMAGVSAFLSCGIIMTIAPVGWPSLGAVLFTLFWTGLFAAAFGFFVFPRTCEDSFQNGPIAPWHWAIVSIWALSLIVGNSQTAYAIHKVRSLNDPAIDLVFFKWTPDTAGNGEELRVARGPYDTFPYLKDEELNQLRAAGLTGTVHPCGSNMLPGFGPHVRVVIIMSRGLRETVDLPKPAKDNILYIQTEEGWKAFPSSAPTLPRTIRLSLSEGNAHHFYPATIMTTDMGMGQPSLQYGLPTFEWTPDEFEAPLPSLAQ